MTRRRGSDDDGFTLIELIVVTIILGILGAIAIPIYLGQNKKAYNASIRHDLRTVAIELNTYYAGSLTFLATGGWGAGATATLAPSTSKSTAADTASLWASSGSNRVGTDLIRLSPNNTVQVAYAGSNGFCLVGWNSRTSEVYTYDSLAGGVQAGVLTTWGTSKCLGTGY